MTVGLKRYYGAGYLHFVTTSCYHRRPLFTTAERKDLFLEVLEQVRRRYHFVVVGYVVMSEHVHLLLGEPSRGNLSVVMQALKQQFTRKLLRTLPKERVFEACVWQRRFYDFVVWSSEKRVEKLDYIHLNPVNRGLVSAPGEWKWSSYRHYAYGEPGIVRVNETFPAELKFRDSLVV